MFLSVVLSSLRQWHVRARENSTMPSCHALSDRELSDIAGWLVSWIKTSCGHSVLLPDRRLVNDRNENMPLQISRLFALG
jgi:hypothetical protein